MPDRSLPLRRADLVAALARQPVLCETGQAKIAALARRITKLFHLEYFTRRETLKDLYVEMNPDRRGRDPLIVADSHYAEFLAELRIALQAANFNEVSRDEIDWSEENMGRVRAKVLVPWDLYSDIRLFVRGRRMRPIRWRSLWGLKRNQAEGIVYDQVVVVTRVRDDLTEKEQQRTELRPGALYLKLFRDIPGADLNTLFPHGRVVMSALDRLMLWVPAVFGGIPVMLKLVPALSIIAVVASAYLGFKGSIEDDHLKKIIAVVSGVIAVVGFAMAQWIKWERQALRYQKQVADNAYFKNLLNNAAFFDFIIGASEEAEVKEVMLAYFFLLADGGDVPTEGLSARIEDWIEREFHVRVNFDIDDALAKLERYELCSHGPDGFRAVPMDIAHQRAARAWARLADEEWEMPGKVVEAFEMA